MELRKKESTFKGKAPLKQGEEFGKPKPQPYPYAKVAWHSLQANKDSTSRRSP